MFYGVVPAADSLHLSGLNTLSPGGPCQQPQLQTGVPRCLTGAKGQAVGFVGPAGSSASQLGKISTRGRARVRRIREGRPDGAAARRHSQQTEQGVQGCGDFRCSQNEERTGISDPTRQARSSCRTRQYGAAASASHKPGPGRAGLSGTPKAGQARSHCRQGAACSPAGRPSQSRFL